MASNKREREANIMKKRKMARNRFRNLIRSVALNRIWLMDLGEQKLSLNVKKNIAMLVRTKRKIGLLTLAEKALIRTNNQFRTIEDRKKLVTLLAGMTCFSRIPPKVRARLVPVIKFMVMSPGRKIIKEGDEPSTIYFVLTGEVEITKRVWDHIKNEYVDKVDFICGPGDVLGDIELLEKTPRRNTFVTTTDVEVLVVFYDDFNRILRPVMSKQWLEKKAAIMALHYFDFLNEEQVIAACKLGMVRQFEPLETIYYEDKGHVSYVHFVISGECMILQCLKMRVTQRPGGKLFDLVDIGKDDQDSMFQDLTSVDLLKKLKQGEIAQNTTNYNLTSQIDTSSEDAINGQTGTKKAVRKMDIKTIEIACGLRKASAEHVPKAQVNAGVAENLDEMQPTEFEKNAIEHFTSNEDVENLEIAEVTEFENLEEGAATNDDVLAVKDEEAHVAEAKSGANITDGQEVENKTSVTGIEFSKSKTQLTSDASKTKTKLASFSRLTPIPSATINDDVESIAQTTHTNESAHTLAETKSSHVTILPKNEVLTRIENHFIDVGSMSFGAIFGLGEKLEHRVIMARTTVQCLMLPRFWLLEKEQNPGNAWQRRRFYLDSTIPSRDTLFKDFLTTRKWQKFKNDLVQNINANSTGNPTKVQDIPVICRIVEANDD